MPTYRGMIKKLHYEPRITGHAERFKLRGQKVLQSSAKIVRRSWLGGSAYNDEPNLTLTGESWSKAGFKNSKTFTF